MKFYKVIHHNLVRAESYVTMDEYEDGQWATRDDAEQAARDAVGLAKAILGYDGRLELWDKAQSIIERYEGGTGNG